MLNQKKFQVFNRNWSAAIFSSVLIIGGFIFLMIGWRNLGLASIQIEWETASEFDTIGFNILRSEFEEGPFEQVNQQLIPPASDPLTGGAYNFTDRQAETGKIY
jgi:hypothetical protein